MNYSPKLKKACEEIKAILIKHDIAGIVFLHTPGHGEYLVHINPTYSCCEIDMKNGSIRTKAKLADFGGDKARWTKKVTNTANMLELLTEMPLDILPPITDMAMMLNRTVDAEHTSGGNTTSIEQNN